MLRLYLLYREAFPKCERKPFSIIRAMAKLGKTDLWYFEDEKGFAAFQRYIVFFDFAARRSDR